MPVIFQLPNEVNCSGLDTSDATAAASDILNGKTAYAKGNKITGTIQSLDTSSYMPSTEDQVIESGQYLLGTQTIRGDSSLVSDNIKSGTSIFGVNGKESVVDTSDATAAASDILNGKTAYVDGNKVEGSISTLGETTYTPSVLNQTIESGQYLSGSQIILGDENLIAANIKRDVSIFGVTGTYSGGGGEITEFSILDCTDLTSSAEVVAEYSSSIMTSNDGLFETFIPLKDYVYNEVSAIYFSPLAGISIRSANNSTGFYSTIPITITSSHSLLKIKYIVSAWINPSITIHLIDAMSPDEIPDKIRNHDYAYSESVVLAAAGNNTNHFLESTTIPIGEHYFFVETPTATGGNEALINFIGMLCI